MCNNCVITIVIIPPRITTRLGKMACFAAYIYVLRNENDHSPSNYLCSLYSISHKSDIVMLSIVFVRVHLSYHQSWSPLVRDHNTSSTWIIPTTISPHQELKSNNAHLCFIPFLVGRRAFATTRVSTTTPPPHEKQTTTYRLECALRRRHWPHPMRPLPHITPRRRRPTNTFSSRCVRGNAVDSPKSFGRTTMARRSCDDRKQWEIDTTDGKWSGCVVGMIWWWDLGETETQKQETKETASKIILAKKVNIPYVFSFVPLLFFELHNYSVHTHKNESFVDVFDFFFPIWACVISALRANNLPLTRLSVFIFHISSTICKQRFAGFVNHSFLFSEYSSYFCLFLDSRRSS